MFFFRTEMDSVAFLTGENLWKSQKFIMYILDIWKHIPNCLCGRFRKFTPFTYWLFEVNRFVFSKKIYIQLFFSFTVDEDSADRIVISYGADVQCVVVKDLLLISILHKGEIVVQLNRDGLLKFEEYRRKPLV